jgi:Ribosomal protein L7/L12 C-terminal domain
MNQLANMAAAMIALRDDPVLCDKVLDVLATKHPELLLDIAGELGIVKIGIRIKSLNFPLDYISSDIFEACRKLALAAPHGWNSPKIEAIKFIRAETKCGLKEAKDFVEFYFPEATLRG